MAMRKDYEKLWEAIYRVIKQFPGFFPGAKEEL
jgi:hypothetical protein